jgi:tetratricopeptide (TPR) repeat protein
MSDALAALRARHRELAARLAAPTALAERAALKGELADLYRAIEAELAELSGLKGDTLALIDRWKALPAEGGSRSPTPPGVRPRARTTPAAAGGLPMPPGPDGALVQADHLGASTFIEKGWHQISAGDALGAERSLRRALELSPGDAQAEALLGWAQMLQEKHDDALLVFQRVLLRDPSNSLARVNVGYICLKKGIFGEAIEHLSRVIRLDNDRKATLYAHFYLGLVYLEREMYEDAGSFFRRSLALGPNLIEAYYELGRAQWFGGDPEAARRTWRDGFTANRFSPWGKRCAEMLEAVEQGGAPTR